MMSVAKALQVVVGFQTYHTSPYFGLDTTALQFSIEVIKVVVTGYCISSFMSTCSLLVLHTHFSDNDKQILTDVI